MEPEYKKLNLGEFNDSLGSFVVSARYDSNYTEDSTYDSTNQISLDVPKVYKIVDMNIPKGVDLIACAFGMCGGGCSAQDSCPSYD